MSCVELNGADDSAHSGIDVIGEVLTLFAGGDERSVAPALGQLTREESKGGGLSNLPRRVNDEVVLLLDELPQLW